MNIFFDIAKEFFFKDKLIYYKNNLTFVLFLNVIIYILLIISQLIKMGFTFCDCISCSILLFFLYKFFSKCQK